MTIASHLQELRKKHETLSTMVEAGPAQPGHRMTLKIAE